MAIAQRIIASGNSPATGVNIVGDVSSALTATGSSQATSLLLQSIHNNVTTTAASTGVQLPSCSNGDCITVWNSGASTLSVYGQTGEAISSGAVNAAFSVATNKGAMFIKLTSTLWFAILTA